jgi:hypothetical protein
LQKSFHQAQAEIYVSFDLMVVAVAAQKGNQVMRFPLTYENPNNPVPMDRLMETSVATGAQEGNRTPDLLAVIPWGEN